MESFWGLMSRLWCFSVAFLFMNIPGCLENYNSQMFQLAKEQGLVMTFWQKFFAIFGEFKLDEFAEAWSIHRANNHFSNTVLIFGVIGVLVAYLISLLVHRLARRKEIDFDSFSSGNSEMDSNF